MKKIFILLATLALLSLTACISKDATDKLQENTSSEQGTGGSTTTGGGIEVPVVKNKFAIYSSETGLTEGVVLDHWNTAATITDENNIDGYSKVYKIVAGNGWGAPTACIAFKELGDYQSKYQSISFKIKSESSAIINVKVPEVEKSFTISNGTDLGNGWYQLTIPFSDYSGTEAGATQIGIFTPYNNAVTFYITDVVLTEK